MWRGWSVTLIRLALALAAAVLVGLVTGNLALCLALVLGALLAGQLVALYRVQRWLRGRVHDDPPGIGGVWGDVLAIVTRIQRRRKHHKRQAMRQFREFRRLTAALPDGVVLLSGQHEIRWFNREAARLLGLRRKLDLGIPIGNLVRDPAFAAALQRPGASHAVVIRLPDAEASLALMLVPVGDQILMLARDVTREVRLEELRKDFVANASHELRSPLTVVSGYLEAISEDEALAPAWRGPVADMRKQAGRMQEIVEDLLELSRLESAGHEAPMTPVDVPALIERAAGEARAAAPAAPSLLLDVERGCLVRGSESELHSIIANLVSNAVKYTPGSGNISIRWSREPGGAVLSVRDTGIGIAPEHLPRLTERFYRVDRSRSRERGGSGLGLSIVKHALQRHGGALEIASEPGLGSTFTARFPARRIATRTEPATKAS